MKKRNIITVVLLLVLTVRSGLIAEELSFEKDIANINISPTIETYFTNMMTGAHEDIALTESTPYVISDLAIKTKFGYTDNDVSIQLNAFAGTMIPVFKHFALPLYAGIVIDSVNEDYFDLDTELAIRSSARDWESGDPPLPSSVRLGYSASGGGYIIGSGFVFYGKFGVLAGYGLSFENTTYYDDILVESNSSYWDYEYEGTDVSVDNSKEGLNWAVFPVFNAGEVPLLNSVFNLIDGFFNVSDALSMTRGNFKPTYKINTVFRDLGDSFRLSANVYKITDWHDFNTKYNLVAGGVKFAWGDKDDGESYIRIEAGYRDFFDTVRMKDQYENGVYTKLAVKFVTYDGTGYGAFITSGGRALFDTPVFGVTVSINNVLLFRVFGRTYNDNTALDGAISVAWHWYPRQ